MAELWDSGNAMAELWDSGKGIAELWDSGNAMNNFAMNGPKRSRT